MIMSSENGLSACRLVSKMRRIKWYRSCVSLLGTLLISLFVAPSIAADKAKATVPEYSPDRTQTCLDCHDEDEEYPVHSIFRTAHGVAGDSRSPLGSEGCESCHGPSGKHADKPRKNSPNVSFGPKWTTAASARTEICAACHKGEARIHWEGSVHELEDLSCTDCHRAHANRDPITVKSQQAGLCFNCHKTQQAELNLPSRHPIKEGKTICSDCHNPHGSSTMADLVQPSLIETCVSCHKEKRGPFIFEHAPAAEDCSECHRPHGSTQPSLLVSRPPFLCQQCHMVNAHPSQLHDGTGLPSGRPNFNLLAKGCLNCHSQVHGTNHPSGARLTR